MNKLSLEEAMKRLEEIVSKIEKNEESLEKSIELFKEGMELSKYCHDKLNNFEQEIIKIVDQK